jgi:hypothetical protein
VRADFWSLRQAWLPARAIRPMRAARGRAGVNDNSAVFRAKDSRWDLDDASKGRRVTNSTHTFGTVSTIRPEVFGSSKLTRQWLPLLHLKLVTETFGMKSAVAVITGVWVPPLFCPRDHHEKLPADFAGPTRRAIDRRPVQPRRTAFRQDEPGASSGPFWDFYSCGLRRNMIATAAIRQVSVSPDRRLDT